MTYSTNFPTQRPSQPYRGDGGEAFVIKLSEAPVTIEAEGIAQIADGGGWKTSITLANLEDKAVAYKLQFWDSNGQPLTLPLTGIGSYSALEGTLPVAGSVTIETEGTSSALLQGCAALDAGSGSLSGVAVFCQRVPDRPDLQAVVPLSSRHETRYVLPFDNTAEFTTSMAIVNPSASATATVTAALRTESGERILLDQFMLGPRNHAAFAIPATYPQPAGRRGTIEFSTTGPELTALGLRFNESGAFTSFPPLSHPAW